MSARRLTKNRTHKRTNGLRFCHRLSPIQQR
jgi:hypothetical protein